MDLLAQFAVLMEYAYAWCTAAALAIGLLFFKKRLALLLGLLVVLALVPALKLYYLEERPCVAGGGLFPCPEDFGMPSSHAAAAGVFAAAAVGSPAFFIILPLSALAGYSRAYAGVHSFEQVAAGFAVGLAAYSLALWLRGKLKRRRETPAAGGKAPAHSARFEPNQRQFELNRQLAHAAFGLAVIVIAVVLGKAAAIAFLLACAAVGITAAHFETIGTRLPLVHQLVEKFERNDAPPFKGAVNYAAGSLLAVTLAPTLEFGLAIVAMLAFGDAASTIAGKLWGKTKVHWNERKTWKGAVAFFIAGGVTAIPFLGAAAFAYSLALALVETLPLDVDDNLLIPVAALALNALASITGVAAMVGF
ncbi:MAG: phosphatase PAP2 family protein [Candidatus Micrarchaeota archaeon]